MAKLSQHNRAVIIGLTLLLILASIAAFIRLQIDVPPDTQSPDHPIVTTLVPIAVPSAPPSAAPETKPNQYKTKGVLSHISKSTLDVKTAQVPVMDTTNLNAVKPAPISFPNEVGIMTPESMAAFVNKPAMDPALQPSPEPTPASFSKETVITAPEPPLTSVPIAVQDSKLSASLPSPSAPTNTKLVPTNTNQTAPSGPSEGTIIVDGTVAAIVLAPIAVPVAVVVGIASGVYSKFKDLTRKSSTEPNVQPKQ
jgi:hypothetical protein